MNENVFHFKYAGFSIKATVIENRVIVEGDQPLPSSLIAAARAWFLKHQEEFNLVGLKEMDG